MYLRYKRGLKFELTYRIIILLAVIALIIDLMSELDSSTSLYVFLAPLAIIIGISIVIMMVRQIFNMILPPLNEIS